MCWQSFKIWTFMALRFVLRHQRKTIATGSFIVLGTAVLVLLHALTIGINDTMVANSTRLHSGNAFLEFPVGFQTPDATAREIDRLPDVQTTLLRYRLSALVSSRSRQAPMVLYAVRPGIEAATTAIAKKIVAGDYPKARQRELLLGIDAARQLQIAAGDTVSILESSGLRLGEFTVSGLYQTEIPHFDNTIGYLPVQSLDSSLLKKTQAELAIFTEPSADLQQTIRRVALRLPGDLVVKSWQDLMPDLVQLIEMNEVAMRIIILFVFLLVGFGISNSFVLTIVERFREFGILKAMGVTPRDLIGLVFMESFIVCLVATLAGLLLGGLFTQIMAGIGIDFSGLTSHNRYFVVSGLVRPRTTPAGLYWPGLLSIIAAVVASYLPARIAARKGASETLRYT